MTLVAMVSVEHDKGGTSSRPISNKPVPHHRSVPPGTGARRCQAKNSGGLDVHLAHFTRGHLANATRGGISVDYSPTTRSLMLWHLLGPPTPTA